MIFYSVNPFLSVLGLLFVFEIIRGFSLAGQRNDHPPISDELTGDSRDGINGSACSTANVDTSSSFQHLNFHASWIDKKYFWNSEDFNFEKRSKMYKKAVVRNQSIIKVFVLPHSHNDPGWLNTYEQYYNMQTKHVLNNAVEKLLELPAMTFVWNEITYLAKWWRDGSPAMREKLKRLVNEGRLEISTGGWVMPDEATPSLYSFIHELTEGQQWLKNHLNIKPKYAWAIDPFGHSSTFSHLLKSADMEGMVIQRLHYAWKHWLAEHKIEEFKWRPRWDTTGSSDIPCLSLPYDLYSIKHACGPDPQVCLKFDFRKIDYEYGENYGIMTPITSINVRQAAQEIVAQYYKTSSLTNHNVVLVPLGDDFRYDRALEWDQQYSNYMQLFSHINLHKDKYRMQIRFGTLRDYFEAVNGLNEQTEQRPSLAGDFFPYGDVYVSGKPSYWTGFYGSRPYWKRFYREVENELRSAEILFTYANSLAQKDNLIETKRINQVYSELVEARHDFAIFAHHDGVTGTSRRWTMDDYGYRLHSAFTKCVTVQSYCLRILHQRIANKEMPLMSKDYLRESFGRLPTKVPLEIFKNNEYVTKVMLFNSIGWKRDEFVKVLVKKVNVGVTNSQGENIPSQINPVFLRQEYLNHSTVEISDRMYELVFLASLDPLSLTVYQITQTSQGNQNTGSIASVQCASCINLKDTAFTNLDSAQNDDITIQNNHTILHFQHNGLLEKIERPVENKSLTVSLSYGFYTPASKESGAYLLKPIISTERMFFDKSLPQDVIKIVGPIMSQIISTHSSRYETIKVNTTLFHKQHDSSRNGTWTEEILVETFVDFTRDYTNKVEAFMRLKSGLNTKANQNDSDENHQSPIMYTDQNGFVSEKRTHVPSIGYEGNTYPVTTMTYIQDEDENLRLSILVDRTHGFCSIENGQLETLIERRSTYDDGRGLSEGVIDSKPTVSSYILLVESLDTEFNFEDDKNEFSSWQPTLHAYKASLQHTYPPNIFVYAEGNEEGVKDPAFSLISSPLPENVHLINLRTLSTQSTDTNLRFSYEEPDKIALMNLQYLPTFNGNYGRCNTSVTVAEKQIMRKLMPAFNLQKMNVSRVALTSLTGVVGNDTGKRRTTPRGNSLLVNLKLFFS